MKKKRLIMMCLMLVVVLLFTGCSKPKVNNETSGEDMTRNVENKDEGKQDNKTQELEPYEMVWYMPNTPQKDHELVEAEINKILKEKINATVKINFIDWSNYEQQMQVLMSTGEKMDLVFTSNWMNDYITGVNKGAFKEIKMEDLKKYAPNVIDGVPSKAWDAAKVNGKLYAMINTQVIARWPAIIIQNKFADKYDFDITKMDQLNDLTPLLENIAKNEEGIYPIDINKNLDVLGFYITKLGLEYFGGSNPFGLYMNDADLKLVNIYETPEIKDFFMTMRDWYNKGIIRSDASTVSDMNAEKSNGLVASIFAVNNPDTVVNQARAMGLKPEDLTIQPLSEPVLSTGGIIATMTAISNNSENPERCMMLYNLMYDKNDTRLINLLSFGIEDKHYKKIEDDLIEVIPNSGYYVDCGWEYGNLFNCMRTNPLQPEWYPTGPNINESAIVSKVLGFNIDTTSIKSELAQMKSVFDEYMPALMTGSVDVDEYLDKFLNKLEKAGSKKVQQEIQDQLDKWKASK